MGYKKAIGIDPFLNPSDSIVGGGIIEKRELTSITESFDVIWFNHSFEHMIQPQQTMKKVYDLLGDNGVCIIALPCIDSPNGWGRFRDNWAGADAPVHICLYSKQGISLLCEQNNLVIERTYYEDTIWCIAASRLLERGIHIRETIHPLKSYFTEKEWTQICNQVERNNKDELAGWVAFKIRRKK